MKILQIINSLSGGGAEVFAVNLSIELSKLNNNKIYFMVYQGILDKKGIELKNRLEKNNIEFYNLNLNNDFKKTLCPLFYAFHINNLKPDIVHSHLDQSDFFTYLSSFLVFKKPSFFRTLHTGSFIKRIPKIIHKKCHSFFNNIACSESVMNDLKSNGYNKKIYFINNGIKFDINYDNEIKSYRNKNKFTLINIGNMNSVHGLKVKGQELLIKAIAKLPKNLLQNTEVILLGDGTHINYYKSLAHDLKIDKKIKFKGLVNDVKGYLNKSDLAIFPSLFEGLPLAAIEASIAGLPLITSDIIAFDIFDNNCNLRFKKNNVKGLTNKIIYALENLESLKNHSIKSISKYRKIFSIKNTAKEYHIIYSKIK